MIGFEAKCREGERFLCEQDAIFTKALTDILTEQSVAFRTEAVFGAGLAVHLGPILERTRFFVSDTAYEQAKEILEGFFEAAGDIEPGSEEEAEQEKE